MPNLFEHMLDFADVLLLPLLALFLRHPWRRRGARTQNGFSCILSIDVSHTTSRRLFADTRLGTLWHWGAVRRGSDRPPGCRVGIELRGGGEGGRGHGHMTLGASLVHMFFVTNVFSLSSDAPTISATFAPFLYAWKVGMAEMPHSCATSSFSSTSTFTKTTSGYSPASSAK